jgi:N-carbamoylputrescine amidase
MRVTVCELPDDRAAFEAAWTGLVAHSRRENSELVLLPEMPFCAWFADTRQFDSHVWEAAVRAHDEWEQRLHELGPAVVAATRPVDFGNERYNEAFVWDVEQGSRAVHAQSLLPEEDGVWEASWYNRATPEFTPLQVGPANIGFLICTELWRMDQAETYGAEDVELLLTPRSTSVDATPKWLAAGRVAAILAGAYSVSSNRVSPSGAFGGHGWIIDPEGNLLGTTDAHSPYLTFDVSVVAADAAKSTHFPRYGRARPAHEGANSPSLVAWR